MSLRCGPVVILTFDPGSLRSRAMPASPFDTHRVHAWLKSCHQSGSGGHATPAIAMSPQNVERATFHTPSTNNASPR